MRTIKAYSKATRTLSTKMMHGNTWTRDEGHSVVLYAITDKSDAEIVAQAKEECERNGLELWKVFVVDTKPTSFSTNNATWLEKDLYRDDTRAEYYEGHFDNKGNRID